MVHSEFCVIFILIGTLFVASAFPGKREDSCDASYLKLGCYNDKHASGRRPLPTLLFTDRDDTSKEFSGMTIDWSNWGAYMKRLLCRCAERSKVEGYLFFGVQFYGECWASKEFTFNIDGLAEGCVSSDLEPCSPSSKACVGEQNTIFVYNVQH